MYYVIGIDMLCAIDTWDFSLFAQKEKHVATMPKRNAEFWAKSKGLRIFIKSLNLLDLALDMKN